MLSKRQMTGWSGVVWYMDEHGERKRKSFSGTAKADVNKKMTDYIADLENHAEESDESKKTLQDSMQRGLHSLRHPFAINLVNGQKQPDGTIRALSPRQVVDLLGHSASHTMSRKTRQDSAAPPKALRCKKTTTWTKIWLVKICDAVNKKSSKGFYV